MVEEMLAGRQVSAILGLLLAEISSVEEDRPMAVLRDGDSCSEILSCGGKLPSGSLSVPFSLEGLGADDLVGIITEASRLLRQLGAEPSKRLPAIQVPERLRITKAYRIFIQDRDSVEIKMQPLTKAVFILFLRHEEGIDFKDLSLHEEELMEIYGVISGRDNVQAMRDSVRHLIDTHTNNANTQRSSLLRNLLRYFEEPLVSSYCISGSRGGKKKISIDRSLIQWE